MIPVAVSVVVVVVVVVPVSPLASVVPVSLSSDFAQENTPNVRKDRRVRMSRKYRRKMEMDIFLLQEGIIDLFFY